MHVRRSRPNVHVTFRKTILSFIILLCFRLISSEMHLNSRQAAEKDRNANSKQIVQCDREQLDAYALHNIERTQYTDLNKIIE